MFTLTKGLAKTIIFSITILTIILIIWFSICISYDIKILSTEEVPVYPKLYQGAVWTIRIIGYFTMLSEISKGLKYMFIGSETINKKEFALTGNKYKILTPSWIDLLLS